MNTCAQLLIILQYGSISVQSMEYGVSLLLLSAHVELLTNDNARSTPVYTCDVAWQPRQPRRASHLFSATRGGFPPIRPISPANTSLRELIISSSLRSAWFLPPWWWCRKLPACFFHSSSSLIFQSFHVCFHSIPAAASAITSRVRRSID
jgi:hypothetical protein